MAKSRFALATKRASRGGTALAKMKGKQALSRARASAKKGLSSRRMFAVGTAALVGFGERRGVRLPSVLGIEPTLLMGAVGAFLLPDNAMLGGATNGLLDVAAYKIASGQAPIMGGDDDDETAGEGGWDDVP